MIYRIFTESISVAGITSRTVLETNNCKGKSGITVYENKVHKAKILTMFLLSHFVK